MSLSDFRFHSIGYVQDTKMGEFSGGKWIAFLLPFDNYREGVTRTEFVKSIATWNEENQEDFWSNAPFWISVGDTHREAEQDLYEKYLNYANPRNLQEKMDFIFANLKGLQKGVFFEGEQDIPSKASLNEVRHILSNIYECLHCYSARDEKTYNLFLDAYNIVSEFVRRDGFTEYSSQDHVLALEGILIAIDARIESALKGELETQNIYNIHTEADEEVDATPPSPGM